MDSLIIFFLIYVFCFFFIRFANKRLPDQCKTDLTYGILPFVNVAFAFISFIFVVVVFLDNNERFEKIFNKMKEFDVGEWYLNKK